MATDAFYEDWFEVFTTKLAREDPNDLTAPFIDLNRPEDRERILLVDENGLQQALPPTGDIDDNQKELLYHAAEEGRLMVIPLGQYQPLQAGVEDGHELNEIAFDEDFKNGMGLFYDKPLVEPVLKELNIFKQILNALFGAFSEEKQAYIDDYNAAVDNYRREGNVYYFLMAHNDPNSNYKEKRMKSITTHNENWRRNGRQMLEVTINALKDDTLPSWERDALRVKQTLWDGMVNEGTKNYTKEEAVEMLTTLALDTLLSGKKESSRQLAQQMKDHPEQLETLRGLIRISQSIQSTVQAEGGTSSGTITSCALYEGMAEHLAGMFKVEVANRKAAAKTLVEDNLMEPVANDMEGVKKLFNNPKIDERVTQLLHARSQIPEELLEKATEKQLQGSEDNLINRNNVQDLSGKLSTTENRDSLDLNDPRVLETFKKLREAAQNEPAKAKEIIGMGMNK